MNFVSKEYKAHLPSSNLGLRNAAYRLTPVAIDFQNDGHYPVQVEEPIEASIPGDNMFGLRNRKGDRIRRDILKFHDRLPNDTLFHIIPNNYNDDYRRSFPTTSLISDSDYSRYAKLFNALVKNPKLKTNIK